MESDISISHTKISGTGFYCLIKFTERLRASNCDNITDDTIQYLCNIKRHLDLSRCKNITREGILLLCVEDHLNVSCLDENDIKLISAKIKNLRW